MTCATYQTEVASSRSLLQQGRTSEAVQELKPLAESDSRDKLVYLLDYATALRIAGDYKQAQRVYIQADRLAEELDYHSVSNIAAAALTSEEMLQYKGESYEKILINAMNALTFLAEGNQESALVEVRRILEKVKKIRSSGRADYEPNPFAHYLSAVIWEAGKNYDSAYIEYEKAYELDPLIPTIRSDLVRSAKLARREERHRQWKNAFPDVTEQPEWYDRAYGELIVFIEQGWGPRKQFSYHDQRVPMLTPVFSDTRTVRVNVEAKTPVFSKAVYDIEQNSIRTFEADKAWFIARKIGSTIAKDLVAERLHRENQALGVAAYLFMHMTDRADLRQWSTLPQTIQIARVRLTSGEYSVTLQGLDQSGAATADRLDNQTIRIRSGQTSFLTWRTLR